MSVGESCDGRKEDKEKQKLVTVGRRRRPRGEAKEAKPAATRSANMQEHVGETAQHRRPRKKSRLSNRTRVSSACKQVKKQTEKSTLPVVRLIPWLPSSSSIMAGRRRNVSRRF